MKTRTLLFKTWELFRSWYVYIKTKFPSANLKKMFYTTRKREVTIILAY